MSDPVLSFNERRRFKNRLRQSLHIGSIRGQKGKVASKKPAGPMPEKGESEEGEPQPWSLKKILAGMAVVVLVVIGISHLYANYRHDQDIKKLGGVKQKTAVIATAKQEENRYKKVDDQNLKNGDVESYQIAKLSLVNSYLLQKDYKNASRLLGDIKKNVPGDKLQTSYYIFQLQIDVNNANVNAQKADLVALIALYKSQKRDTLAAAYQQSLDKLNGVKPQSPPAEDKTKSPVLSN